LYWCVCLSKTKCVLGHNKILLPKAATMAVLIRLLVSYSTKPEVKRKDLQFNSSSPLVVQSGTEIASIVSFLLQIGSGSEVLTI
jgi:hypothetical protein